MTFGPRTSTSPGSPTAASVPSGATTRTSVKNIGVPADPALRTLSSGRSSSTPGEASVIPKPCTNVSPRSW